MEAQVRLRTEAGVAILDVSGELDLYTSPRLKAGIEDAVAQGHIHLIVNLLGAAYLDSTALSVLTAALKQVSELGGALALVYNQPHITKMFAVTGLNEVFRAYASESDALEAAKAWTSVREG